MNLHITPATEFKYTSLDTGSEASPLPLTACETDSLLTGAALSFLVGDFEIADPIKLEAPISSGFAESSR